MSTQYIARISYGKDSLKMLEVIASRGLPLDRITTTDVWATDTISANLPPMDEFKARMDERIWQLYRIDVEHLCARNPDGTKRTYEQMFYHVPKRRSQIVNVERESRFSAADPQGFPVLGHPWCQTMLKRRATDTPPISAAGQHQRIPRNCGRQLVSEAQDQLGSQLRSLRGAGNSRSTKYGHLFRAARHGGQDKYRGVHWHCC